MLFGMESKRFQGVFEVSCCVLHDHLIGWRSETEGAGGCGGEHRAKGLRPAHQGLLDGLHL